MASPMDGAHEWSEELKLGIPSFDSEHRAFLSLINRFVGMVERSEPRMVLEATFDKVVDIFQFHSADEENLLDAHDYPHLDRHAIEHHRISSLLNSLRMEFMVSEALHEQVGFARLVGKTIVEHIHVHDRHFARFMLDKTRA